VYPASGAVQAKIVDGDRELWATFAIDVSVCGPLVVEYEAHRPTGGYRLGAVDYVGCAAGEGGLLAFSAMAISFLSSGPSCELRPWLTVVAAGRRIDGASCGLAAG